ncbi:MAG: DUF2459 domain-containing protein [Tsuneonella suprasediminis]|nr:DUF2459 domain-containing protein [Altererythrobacter sp. N1]
MAAPTRHRLIRAALTGLIGLIAAVLCFAVICWVGSSIPRNAEWQETGHDVEIMVETNGVHTALVLPLIAPEKDWRTDFPAGDLRAPLRPYTHISISWGERAVFLDTPRWRDISPVTILRATTGSSSLLHVAHYVRPAPGNDIRPLRLTSAEYRRLVTAIEQSIAPTSPQRHYPGYDSYDVFYDAVGTYWIGRTCNQWTSDMLAAAGVKVGRWTPFSGGVMKWIAPAPAGISLTPIQNARERASPERLGQ